MKKMRLWLLLLLSALCAACLVVFAACAGNENGGGGGGSTYSDYYSFDVSGIATVMLRGESQELDPVVRNLGDVVENARYDVSVRLDGADVTAASYNAETKLFSPADVGAYAVQFTARDEETGELAVDEDGNNFTRTVEIEVSILTFEAKASAGTDVTIDESDEDNVTITFGESYATDETAAGLDSGQYTVKGLAFEGNFSVTYKIAYGTFNDNSDGVGADDPALYFGFDRTDDNSSDDCIKLSTGTGNFATWIWDGTNQADLSNNEENGWNFNVWYNTNASVLGANEQHLEDTVHFLTVERWVSAAGDRCVYVLLWDYEAFAYLDVDDNFTSSVAGLWVESLSTNCTISVAGYARLGADTQAPVIESDTSGEYFGGSELNLARLITVTDNVSSVSGSDADYESIFVPSFTVTDGAGDEVTVTNGVITLVGGETYNVTASVTDFSGNTASASFSFTAQESDPYQPVISFADGDYVTASETVAYIGTALYVTAEDYNGNDLTDPSSGGSVAFSVFNAGGTDVTSSAFYTHNGVDGETYYVFYPTEAGVYTVTCTATDAEDNSHSVDYTITVYSDNSGERAVYGWKSYDLQLGGDGIILCYDKLVFTDGLAATSAKIAPESLPTSGLQNWTISFDITELDYTAQGSLNLTLWSRTADGVTGAWEDLQVGGNVNDDLWGFESSTLGTVGVNGDTWVTYQWRSVWQDSVTTEFLPDPEDTSIGCGRDSSAYTQYGTGTHNWKIVCSTEEDGSVTYTYYIDDEIEAVHHLADAHDNVNVIDFLQFQSRYMKGVVSNISITGTAL